MDQMLPKPPNSDAGWALWVRVDSDAGWALWVRVDQCDVLQNHQMIRPPWALLRWREGELTQPWRKSFNGAVAIQVNGHCFVSSFLRKI